jgi:hypothetical protein
MAIVMASAEAVMALGTGAYSGLATADVWTLLVGHAPNGIFAADSNQLFGAVSTLVMAMPAWIAFGVCGFMFVHVCRKRRQRRRIFKTVN